MPEDREQTARATNEAPTPAIARLVEAERTANEIVGRAQKEADEIIASAKRRAQEIRQRADSTVMEGSEASRAREEVEKQKHLILQEGRRRVETMRTAAAARLHEAVEKVVELLVGEA